MKDGKSVANEGSDFADCSGNGRSPIATWAVDKFGEKNPLTDYLVSSQPWITELVSKRNANEHQVAKAGTVTIRNVRIDGATGTIAYLQHGAVERRGHTITDEIRP